MSNDTMSYSVCIEFYAREFQWPVFTGSHSWWFAPTQRKLDYMYSNCFKENGRQSSEVVCLYFEYKCTSRGNKINAEHFKAFTSKLSWTGWVWCQSKDWRSCYWWQQNKELIVHESYNVVIVKMFPEWGNSFALQFWIFKI
jgi:hypothetical protein